MPKGTARTHLSSGEVINHFNGIKIRVVGNGNLKFKFFSLDNLREYQLPDLTLSRTTNVQPVRLANFTEQRAALELKTTNINEYFRVNRILIFSRYFASEYPA